MLPNVTIEPYVDALVRVRDVVEYYRARPVALAASLELEHSTLAAAWAALHSRVPFAALCADLGRAATEALSDDRVSALSIGRVMVRLAADVYTRPEQAAIGSHAERSGWRGAGRRQATADTYHTPSFRSRTGSVPTEGSP